MVLYSFEHEFMYDWNDSVINDTCIVDLHQGQAMGRTSAVCFIFMVFVWWKGTYYLRTLWMDLLEDEMSEETVKCHYQKLGCIRSLIIDDS